MEPHNGGNRKGLWIAQSGDFHIFGDIVERVQRKFTKATYIPAIILGQGVGASDLWGYGLPTDALTPCTMIGVNTANRCANRTENFMQPFTREETAKERERTCT